jgi:predicted O-methyltransferase YrrM
MISEPIMSSFVNIIQYAYLQELRKPVSPQLKVMENYARHNKIPIIDWYSGELLEFVMKLKNPIRVLELGTAIGYSAIRIIQQLSAEATITTIEKSPGNIEKAKEYFEQSGYAKRINLLAGDAKDILPTLTGQFDAVFLDADKRDYAELFELTVPLIAPGGLIVVDNLLWYGYVAEPDENIPESYLPSTRLIREFNKMFFSHPSFKSMLLPIGDGVGLGIKTTE